MYVLYVFMTSETEHVFACEDIFEAFLALVDMRFGLHTRVDHLNARLGCSGSMTVIVISYFQTAIGNRRTMQ